jgi:hypothetical protein
MAVKSAPDIPMAGSTVWTRAFPGWWFAIQCWSRSLHGERKEDAAPPVSWRRWTAVIQRARR